MRRELSVHTRQAGPLPTCLPLPCDRGGKQAPKGCISRQRDGHLDSRPGPREAQDTGRVEGLVPVGPPLVKVGASGLWQVRDPIRTGSGAAAPYRGDFTLTKFLKELAGGAGTPGLDSGDLQGDYPGPTAQTLILGFIYLNSSWMIGTSSCNRKPLPHQFS